MTKWKDKYPVGGVLVTAVNPNNTDVAGYGHVNIFFKNNNINSKKKVFITLWFNADVNIVGNLIENVNFTNVVLTSGTSIFQSNDELYNFI